ncbi:aspartate--ammonia ligase [Paenibacillus filicis]|uniref:Aspartate--ammonia ligase n=1 Tax=Paenibacillus filicis TaxID=669464 RepID=A0ABU9DEB4_9BACL
MKGLWKEQVVVRDYRSLLNAKETQKAIQKAGTFFENRLASELNLTQVTAPLFLRSGTGVNDNLNGEERPVTFTARALPDLELEIVHSLAKWKRTALAYYGFDRGEGIFTRMNAIRRDEELDPLHSLYVDQWDWERVIGKEERNEETLKSIVRTIYGAIRAAEQHLYESYPQIAPILPETIAFVTSQELEDAYPSLSASERESEIAEKYGAVFVMQIGGRLRSGIPHDGRSPDYDDWTLNGDMILWNPVIGQAFEVSSMGIRVDEAALVRQLELASCEERGELDFHRALLEGRLPYSVGGGIGQSRLFMFLLRKAHIAEVQTSVWPETAEEPFSRANVHFLR